MCLWTADLGLRAVDPQGDVFCRGICEHVGQGAQPHAGPVGDGETPRGQQRANLSDGPGDSGPFQAVQLCERGVRELVT